MRPGRRDSPAANGAARRLSRLIDGRANAEAFRLLSPARWWLGYPRGMGAQWKHAHKELAANAKGRIFTKLAKEIMVAARNGADPSMNPRLRMAVDAAKK